MTKSGKTVTLLVADIVGEDYTEVDASSNPTGVNSSPRDGQQPKQHVPQNAPRVNRSKLAAVAKQRYSVAIETLHFSKADLELFVAQDSAGNKLKTEVTQAANSDIVGT